MGSMMGGGKSAPSPPPPPPPPAPLPMPEDPAIRAARERNAKLTAVRRAKGFRSTVLADGNATTGGSDTTTLG